MNYSPGKYYLKLRFQESKIFCLKKIAFFDVEWTKYEMNGFLIKIP